MAVAFDAVAIPTYAFAEVTFSWFHTPVGTPRGVAVIVVQETATDQVSGVTYGGVAMTRVRLDVRTATEAGGVYIYFLGSGIPTGAQMVEVTLTGVEDCNAVSLSVTAAADTAVDVSAGADAGIIANPSLTIVPTVQAEIFYGIFSGLAAPVTTVETGSTHVAGKDYGTDSAMWARKSVAAGGATTIGYTAASDDVCHSALAIKESTAVTHYGVAILSGVGTLAGIGSYLLKGLATLTGSGLLSAIGRATYVAKATLSGLGTVAAIGQRLVTGIATLAGVGTVACIGTVGGLIQYGAATLSGIGSVFVKAVATFAGKTTMAGAGSVVAIGRGIFAGVATLAGIGTVSAVGVKILTGIVTLAGSGLVAAKGAGTFIGKATLTGVGSLSTLGGVLRTATTTLSGVGLLVAAGTLVAIKYGKAILSGLATMTAIGKKKLVAPPGREVASYKPTTPGEVWY